MSCVAGLGGDVPSIVRIAKSNRQILVLDGCPLHCAKNCLERHAITPTAHIDLSKDGIKKDFHRDATADEAQSAWLHIMLPAIYEIQRMDPDHGAA